MSYDDDDPEATKREEMRRREQEARELAALLALKMKSNDDYRLKRNDLGKAFKALDKVPGVQNVDATRWYANGDLPPDRRGLLAAIHPMLHKRDEVWKTVNDTAKAFAKERKRWVWVMLTESRWLVIVLGKDPEDETGTQECDLAGKFQNDQVVMAYAPDGDFRLIGVS